MTRSSSGTAHPLSCLPGKIHRFQALLYAMRSASCMAELIRDVTASLRGAMRHSLPVDSAALSFRSPRLDEMSTDAVGRLRGRLAGAGDVVQRAQAGSNHG
jgi:gamma-glutamylcysteine synthetase